MKNKPTNLLIETSSI